MNPATGRQTPLGVAYARTLSRCRQRHFYRARPDTLSCVAHTHMARAAREG